MKDEGVQKLSEIRRLVAVRILQNRKRITNEVARFLVTCNL